jgi:hypothetical protein
VRGSAHFRYPFWFGKLQANQAGVDSNDMIFFLVDLSIAKKALCINNHIDTE